jgi:cobyrinic acid a,c-diamide synthase
MPRGIIIAAPSSGSGKTVVTLAILRALKNRGLAVGCAKAGPDYIDPGYHAAASGCASANLDIWAMREATLNNIVGAIPGDMVICEGVMGLFDGAGQGGDLGSTADLAAHTGWPVVLVVDAARQSASVAALLRGFATHRPDVSISGVILNKVGSERHACMLKSAIARALPGLSILGAVPREPALALPERHLGLVLAEEHGDIDLFLDQAAALIERAVDLDALPGLAMPCRHSAGNARGFAPPGQRIAIARDRAFAFAYPHLLAGWRNAGAEILPFSPLADEAPPKGSDFIYLPGGYPELYAYELSGAAAFRRGMIEAASRGVTVYGECGGYMVLGEELTDAGGTTHQMLGLLPVATCLAAPRRHLGYRGVAGLNGPWRGQSLRGHEFHYASVTRSGAALPLWSMRDADGVSLGEAGHVAGSVSGSFFHMIDLAG